MIITIDFIIIIILLLLLLLLQTSKLYYRTLLMKKKTNYIKTDNLIINLYYYIPVSKITHWIIRDIPPLIFNAYASIKVT